MPEHHLYEYAVIRVVPRVEREEFLNVGVILYCSRENFLESIIDFPEFRLKNFTDGLEMQELSEYLHAFQLISKGGAEGGPIGLLSIAERFRWLTATRSTVVQTSPVHPGLCTNPQETLLRLHKQLVL